MDTDKKQVLKGGEFLIRESSPDQIFTPEQLNEEQRMMRDMAREFVEKEIIPRVDEIDLNGPEVVPGLLEKAGELGLLGITLPEEYGGFGQDFNTGTALTIALGPSFSFGVAWAAHTGIGTLPILYFGTEEQRQKYLPGLANGQIKAAYCLTEPGSGSDALAAKTKAVLSDDGKHYILNGQKMFITNGGFADLFIVFAKIDGDKFTGFIVDANSEGLTRGPEEKKMGIKGSSTTPIFLENVKVPVENVLGEIGKGHKIAFNILNIGRFKLCAMAIGGCQASITTAVQYAMQRSQFGKPIAEFGAIQHKLAEQAIRTFVVESATYWTSDLINQMIRQLKSESKSYIEAIMESAEEYAIECAMLKVMGSEALDYVVDETVQIHGGYGFIEDYPAARSYRDARINRIFEGTNEINRLLTVDMLLKRAMKGKIDLMTPVMAVQKELMSLPDFGNSGDEGILAEEYKAVLQAKKAVLIVAGAAAQKLMKQLEDEQEIIMTIADMMMDVFAAGAALLRTRKLVQLKGEEAASPYLDMTRVFLSDALERIHMNGRHALYAFAEGDELRMMMLGLKRFTKFKPVNTKALRRNIARTLIDAGRYSF